MGVGLVDAGHRLVGQCVARVDGGAGLPRLTGTAAAGRAAAGRVLFGRVPDRVNGVDHGQDDPGDQQHRGHAGADQEGEHLLAGPLRSWPFLPATPTRPAADHQQPFPVMLLMIT